MSNPLRTAQDYELFVYTILEQYSSIRRSTLAFVRLGANQARVIGELFFDHEIRIVVRELIKYYRLPVTIEWYGYEVWQAEEKLYWYDPQPHPNNPALQSTHPHHRHIQPDIKHNCISAPGLSFNEPNLPLIIREVEVIIQQIEAGN